MARDEKRKKQSVGEAAICTAMSTLPLDVVCLILLNVTPRTLWSSRLVCKRWYSLLISPQFVAARRSATGGAWLVTFYLPVRAAWIVMYNPLLNIQEKVCLPTIDQTWPGEQSDHLFYVSVGGAEGKNLLTVAYHYATMHSDMREIAWNPVSGFTQESVKRSPLKRQLHPPQDVAGTAWTHRYARRFQDGLFSEWPQDASALMAYSESGLRIYLEYIDRWEFLCAMPDNMWQVMKESRCFFVATPGYHFIWNRHKMAAVFQPAKGWWTWVDNIWNRRSSMYGWEKDVVVLPCF